MTSPVDVMSDKTVAWMPMEMHQMDSVVSSTRISYQWTLHNESSDTLALN